MCDWKLFSGVHRVSWVGVFWGSDEGGMKEEKKGMDGRTQ